MPLKAIFLGSLGTLAETTELQRRALNAAFDEYGLGWEWSPDLYRRLAQRSRCCADRVRAYGASRGEDVDADAIHQRKKEILRGLLQQVRVPPRRGLDGMLEASRNAGLRLALVTTEAPEDVDAMLGTAGLHRETFAFVGDAACVASPKPSPQIYRAALAALCIPPGEAIAVEDTPETAQAAEAAGVRCVAFPGAAQVGRRFAAASHGMGFRAQHLFAPSETPVARHG